MERKTWSLRDLRVFLAVRALKSGKAAACDEIRLNA